MCLLPRPWLERIAQQILRGITQDSSFGAESSRQISFFGLTAFPAGASRAAK
jgi:hypothetical protein